MKKIFRVPTALCTAFAAAQALAAPTAVTPQEAQTFQSADPAHFSAAAEFARLPQMPSHGDVKRRHRPLYAQTPLPTGTATPKGNI